jgi:hypothetical protein
MNTALRYINEILKIYSVKIDVVYEGGRHKRENRIYKLAEINNVSEIVEYLVSGGKLKLSSKSMFRSPVKRVFGDCIKEKRVPEEEEKEEVVEVGIFDEVEVEVVAEEVKEEVVEAEEEVEEEEVDEDEEDDDALDVVTPSPLQSKVIIVAKIELEFD